MNTHAQAHPCACVFFVVRTQHGQRHIARVREIGSPSCVTLAAGDIFDFDIQFAVDFAGAVVGAAIGSVARDRVVHVARTQYARADLGVLISNLLACAVVALAAAAPRALHGLVVLGFAGGLSTWSSLAVDVAGMIRERRWGRIALHIPVAFACAVAMVLLLTLVVDRLGKGGGA